jgi:thioredoxin-like negative regulator of GroEL
MTSALPRIGSTDELDRLLAASGTVLVTFTGPACMICRRLAPVLEAVAREAAPAVRAASVDVEASPALAERFEVRSLPTTLVVRDGVTRRRHVGMASGTELRAWLRAANE